MVIDMFCKCPSDLTCVHVLHCEIRFLETIEGLDNDITLHLDLEGCESIFFYISELFNFFYMTLIMSGVTGSRGGVHNILGKRPKSFENNPNLTIGC